MVMTPIDTSFWYLHGKSTHSTCQGRALEPLQFIVIETNNLIYKDPCKIRVELQRSTPFNLFGRLLRCHRFTIGSFGSHRIIGITDGDHPRLQGNFFSSKTLRIALAIEALMMGKHILG